MSRPVLLDLFCGAGGAGMGYREAGFHVVGIDIVDQPRYPGQFIQADVTKLRRLDKFCDLIGASAIHASPPCQKFTAYRRRGAGVGDGYPNLIPQTREMLRLTGLPYVIENVEAACDELVDPVRLCESSFGLDVRRHRLFESNIPLTAPACDHSWQTPRFAPASNRTNLRSTVEVGVYRIPLAVQQKAMGIDWMKLPELSEAIPPRYTRHIGRQIMSHLNEIGEAA